MLLNISNLDIRFYSRHEVVHAVQGLSLELHRGKTLGLVGESGSGKSVTALSIMQLLPPTAAVSGTIHYSPGKESLGLNTFNLLELKPQERSKIRGAEIGMVFQEPMSSLNPVFRCGSQIVETVKLHHKVSESIAREHTLALLEKVKLPNPGRIFKAYPHELSGGQKQRVMIAMALSGQPSILLADEPTTALDVTVQKAILDLLKELRESENLSMLFISHDLSVIAEIADQVAVMSHGNIVEQGQTDQVLQQPNHPYTRGLVACRPSIKRRLHRLPTIEDFQQDAAFETSEVSAMETRQHQEKLQLASPILKVENLSIRYPVRTSIWSRDNKWLDAVKKVHFEVYPGEIFGIAGESGCGKTTLGRVIARLKKAHEGTILYRQLKLQDMPANEFKSIRREIQMVFQDPYASLNPRMTIGAAILEPLETYQLYASKKQRKNIVVELLEKVGLKASHAKRYPREFSGGQRQRICLARALALQPKLLVCDEIVSALDVSVQASILNLLLDLQKEYGLTYIFISHDLSVIRQMCDRVMIMNKGQVTTIGHPEDVFEEPKEAYVQQLIDAIPGKKLLAI